MNSERLHALGFLYPAMLGLQPDLNPAWLKAGISWTEGSFCDHNCVRGDDAGGYDCFAAADNNRGIVPTSMAGFPTLIRWIMLAIDGQRQARDLFMRHDFARYCDDWRIPPAIAVSYREAVERNVHEVNLFGGNPELNDACTGLAGALRDCGHIVNLTTTGGRLMRSDQFRRDLLGSPPNILAVSADDLSPEEVTTYSALSLEELFTLRMSIPRKRGQDRKAIEGLWVARWAEQTEGAPQILFNTVIHERNVDEAVAVVAQLMAAYPKALVNPYLGQSSMYGTAPLLRTTEQLKAARLLIHSAMGWTHDGARIPKRLPFYCTLEAAYRTYEHHEGKLSLALAGYDTWRCYQPNACWYLQFGRSTMLVAKAVQPTHAPGGHLGCTWNSDTVTQHDPIGSVEQVVHFLRDGMGDLAAMAPHPCPGCTMPRLMFHAISTELGMNPALKPAYLEVRQEQAGF